MSMLIGKRFTTLAVRVPHAHGVLCLSGSFPFRHMKDVRRVGPDRVENPSKKTNETSNCTNLGIGVLGSKQCEFRLSGSATHTLTTYNYGGSSDMWEETWSASDINDSDFGVVLAVKLNNIDSSGQAWVDTIRITVYYALPPAEPTFLKQQNGKLLFQQSGRGILL